MNKLMGFYELKSMNIPSIPWEEFTGETKLDRNLLWTIRTAVYHGDDLNLPRVVGVKAEEAEEFANKILNELKGNGIVVYYPFFVAKKSGTLNVYKEKVVIEAVKNDLWNLVTHSKRDVTIRIDGDETIINGNEKFLDTKEKEEILSQVLEVKKVFRDQLLTGKSILLEWSYAVNCNLNKETVGEPYLVFYEARTVI